MSSIYNRRELLTLRRKLRRKETPAEKALWKELRKRKLDGAKFFRQYGVDRFILDFYSTTYRLAIELDGDYHFEGDQPERDATRTSILNDLNIEVLRFRNEEVLTDIASVLARIRNAIEARKTKRSLE